MKKNAWKGEVKEAGDSHRFQRGSAGMRNNQQTANSAGKSVMSN